MWGNIYMVTIQDTEVPPLYNKDSSKKDKKIIYRNFTGACLQVSDTAFLCFKRLQGAASLCRWTPGLRTGKRSGHRGAWLGLPGSLTGGPRGLARSAPRTAPRPTDALVRLGATGLCGFVGPGCPGPASTRRLPDPHSGCCSTPVTGQPQGWGMAGARFRFTAAPATLF